MVANLGDRGSIESDFKRAQKGANRGKSLVAPNPAAILFGVNKEDASGSFPSRFGPADEEINRALDFLEDPKIRDLARSFCMNAAEEQIDLGFNVFSIVSDTYYRENFHSDILASFLDPQRVHGHGARFLRCFLEFLGKNSDVRWENYSDATVEREAAVDLEDEEGRIDILIADKETKHAIIIENKINNAGDMPQQIPRYLKDRERKGYKCDAIVYLRLLDSGRPAMTDWNPEDKERIKCLLHPVPAYDGDESGADLYSGWLKRCMEVCEHGSDAQFLMRQYGLLLKSLGKDNMNKPIMDEFYNHLLGGEGRFRAALEVKSLVDGLVPYLVQRVVEKFQNDPAPFTLVARWNNVACFTGVKVDGAHLCVDIEAKECEESPKLRFRFCFWDREDREGKNKKAEQMLKRMGVGKGYRSEQGGYFYLRKDFELPADEGDLEEHIRSFNKRLEEFIPSH